MIAFDANSMTRYHRFVIKSFRDRETERIFRGQRSRALPPDIQRPARRKLLWLDAASRLDSLRVPPGNRLEALKGDRRGQHSIRINDQWRICFVWRDGDAFEVEITDYH
jgi:proteic killer suppression protein